MSSENSSFTSKLPEMETGKFNSEVHNAIKAVREQYGIAQHIAEEDVPGNMLELLASAVPQSSGRKAFTCLGMSLSYGELDQLTDQFAAYLQNKTNLKQGDRLAVQLPNILQYPVVVFGAIKAGLVLVNVNPMYTQRELTYQLQDSGAKALVALDSLLESVEISLPNTGVEVLITTGIADLAGGLKRWVISGMVKLAGKSRKVATIHNEVSLRTVLAQGKSLPLVTVDIKPTDTAVLQYTGGTTGRSKGAILTYRNLMFNTCQAEEILVKANLKVGEETVVCPLPLYHIFAFIVGMAMMIRLQGHVHLIPDPRNIKSLIKVMKKSKPTVFFGLNTLFAALLRHDDFKKLDLSSLRLTGSGGMALTDDVAIKWRESTGCSISEGYGLTETSPVATLNIPGHEVMGSVGVAVSGSEIQIVNSQGEIQGVDGEGEIRIKGPHVMKGYWQNDEETRHVITTDGWFKTGDMGCVGSDGRLRIMDRKKDMVIVSGFNVYPNEIENVVNLLAGVRECAVVGVPSDATGEALKLFVVCDDSISEKDIINWCREQLTAYKVPRIVVFKEDLPKSNVGKVLRNKLRD